MTENLFLSDVMQLYSAYLQSHHPLKKAQEIANQTETAINRYTLPGFGMKPFKGRKPTGAETERAKVFKQSLSVEELPTLLEAQEKTFKLLQPSADSINVSRSRLKQLITWCTKQEWYPGNTSPVKVIDCCPRRHQNYGPMAKTLLVNRPNLPPYGLRAEQISQELKAETDLFYQFRTAIHWPNRPDEPVKANIAHHEITVIFRVLGWVHSHLKVPLEELSLNTLIPSVELKYAVSKEAAIALAAKAGDYVDCWVCEFCNFLTEERDTKSPNTHHTYLAVILAVAKFQYHKKTSSKDYRDVPAVEVLHQRLTLIKKEFKNYVSDVDMDKKWLDLPEVFKLIVEPLRLECQPKSVRGYVRKGTATASSFQRYVLWGLLTYSPPRRQQELRGLKIVLKCPIKRPVDVPPDGFYQPLPTGNDRDRNYCYLYNLNGRWIRDTPAECYKTGKTYGHQELEIPNVKFPDGRCFYDYLEAWLYGYSTKSDGRWHSCGRLEFSANHDFVFLQHKGKPFNREGMGQYLSAAAHALTGQRVTPHLLRDIFATYFLDNGAPDGDVASLAYAMGHSQEMLKASYDRRTPNQKHRPIQSALSKLVQKSLSEEP
ncbi:tyrosine-type recombinase/integrase [Microcoleus sp. MON1_C1]|uniref:tyrosine-type recombinase/integrase n=1 Tax=Microcoleus sp. MON1_C1 TaxID=2818827 RepID=UPI002FD2C091